MLGKTDPHSPATVQRFLQGGGETGAMLRDMSWSTHPLGPPASWPPLLQAATSIILGSRQPMFLVWGPELSTLYNDGYSLLCGKRHPAALGAPLSSTWSDIWDVVGEMVDRVYGGESIHMDDIAFVMHRNGFAEETHFSFSYSPLRDEKGEVRGLFCACAETTENVKLRRALDHERAMLGQMFENAPGLIAKMEGPDHKFEFANPAYRRLAGNRNIIGQPAQSIVPQAQQEGFLEMLDSVRATGQSVQVDGERVLIEGANGGMAEDRFVDFFYQPVRNMKGAVSGIFVEGFDVTDRINATSALRESEQFLRSVLGSSPDCVKVLNLEGQLEFMNDGGRLVMEIPAEHEVVGRNWQDFWEGIGKAELLKTLDVARSGLASAFQSYSNTFSGSRRYWDVRVTPMLNQKGQPERILAVSRDITYLKRIEDEREFLMGELSHRLGNAFSLVQSVIGQTLRRAISLEEARESLSGRIRALANAQSILTKSIAGDMNIQDVVEAALLPHRTGEGRFRISGPAANINGRQGLGLSLALHELATNATKYGALSDNNGKVSVHWSVAPSGLLEFSWQETDGPLVNPPKRSGFGSVLIETVVSAYFDGSAKLQYLPKGIEFQLTGLITTADHPRLSQII